MMMGLDLKKALFRLNGVPFRTASSLRKRLSEVIWKHRNVLPADFHAQEFLERIAKNGWLDVCADKIMVRF
jgi:hypothetical protein